VSVNILYCEGGKGSPDIRILSNLLAGTSCKLKSAKSKTGLGQKIQFIRQEIKSVVAALKDRDFDQNDSEPVNSPKDWTVKDNEKDIQIGWSWERKEIENYLIDPEVVSRALGSKSPNIEDYQAALENSARTIADYTAARIALSVCWQSYFPLQNRWGNVGIDHAHSFPPSLAESDCRYEIKNIVNNHKRVQPIEENKVMNSFDSLLYTCRVGGNRFKNFLTFFSGKDLLFGMKSELNSWGFQQPSDFRERVVKGIENSPDPDNVWIWLPEWNQLRQLIQKAAF